MEKQTKMLTLFIILINAATVAGYVLAEKPEPEIDQCWLYEEPTLKISAHEWIRDQALAFLEIKPVELLDLTLVDSDEATGTLTYLYESSELTTKVTYRESADAYFVDVSYLEQSWSMRVSPLGECTLIK